MSRGGFIFYRVCFLLLMRPLWGAIKTQNACHFACTSITKESLGYELLFNAIGDERLRLRDELPCGNVATYAVETTPLSFRLSDRRERMEKSWQCSFFEISPRGLRPRDELPCGNVAAYAAEKTPLSFRVRRQSRRYFAEGSLWETAN